MANNYKGYSVEEGRVYHGKTFVKAFQGKYDIDGELLTVWELSARIAEPTTATRKAKKEEVAIPIEEKRSETAIPIPKEAAKVPHEQQTAKRMKGAQSGEENINFKGYYIVAGKRYTTASQAAKEHGKRIKTLIEWCKMGCSFEPKK